MEYRFGQCSVRAEERALRCRGELVPLPPKAIDAVIVLAAHQDEVISKERLMDSVWGSAAVEEANLTQNIYRLRRAFETYDPSVRVETVPRRGYRLTVTNGKPKQSPFVRSRRWIAAALIVCAVSAGAAIALRSRASAPVLMPPSFPVGYYYWSTARSIADVRKSIPYFERAIREQPKSALGYAGLADAYLSLALREGDVRAATSDARTGIDTARRAVSVDGSSSEAHAAYGQAEALFDDSATGERELRRAVQLNPDSVEARTWYGEFLMGEGRIAESMAQLRAALAINSSWTEAGDDLALLSYLRRNYSQAAAFATQSLVQVPNDTQAAFVLALANGPLHRRTEAERDLVPLTRSHDLAAALKAHALLALFYLEDANAQAAKREFLSAKRAVQAMGVVRNPSTIISIAASLALQHQGDAAFAWLARVDPDSRRLFADDARLDGLRADRRFIHWVNRS